MALPFHERIAANVQEALRREPPNGWFNVQTKDQAGRVTVRVSDKFLDMGNGRMKMCWRDWHDTTTKYAKDYWDEQIKQLCHFRPGQIMEKIDYLVNNNGIDRFGRQTALSHG